MKAMKNNASSYKRILIIRLDRLGDVILSTPVIKSVRDAYPASRISVMVRPYCEDVVKGNPYLDEVIVYDKGGREKDFSGNLSFISGLRGRNFDLALILHPTARSHIITFLSGIPERVGYDKKLGWLLTKKIPHTKQFGLKHEIDYTLDILRYIGIESPEKELYMPVQDSSEEKIDGIFSRNGLSGNDTVIALNPAASCASKRWPEKKFAELGDRLVNEYKARIIIISGAEDKALADSVSGLMKSPSLDLSGMTTIGDLASVLKRTALFISNDSGPVHMACALGRPVIAIFGRSDRGLSPRRWGPVGKSDVVLHKDVECHECLAHNCKIGFKCLEAITVDDALAAASRILRHKGVS